MATDYLVQRRGGGFADDGEFALQEFENLAIGNVGSDVAEFDGPLPEPFEFIMSRISHFPDSFPVALFTDAFFF